MAQEKPQSLHELTPPGERRVWTNLEEGTHGLPDYGTLLRQYGKSMLTIGQLEAHVERLNKDLQESPRRESSGSRDDSPVPMEPQSLRDLAEWIEAVQKLFAKSPMTREATTAREAVSSGSHDKNLDEHRRDAELNQMRVQIASLSNQLARAEEDLRQVQQHRWRRSSLSRLRKNRC